MRKRIILLFIGIISMQAVYGNDTESYSLMQFFEHPETDSPASYIQEKTMHLWTALDLLRAITVAEEERTHFCQEFITELLDLHTFIRSLALQETIAENRVAYINTIVSQLAETFEDVFGRFSNDEVSCIRVMINRLHDTLYGVVD